MRAPTETQGHRLRPREGAWAPACSQCSGLLGLATAAEPSLSSASLPGAPSPHLRHRQPCREPFSPGALQSRSGASCPGPPIATWCLPQSLGSQLRGLQKALGVGCSSLMGHLKALTRPQPPAPHSLPPHNGPRCFPWKQSFCGVRKFPGRRSQNKGEQDAGWAPRRTQACSGAWEGRGLGTSSQGVFTSSSCSSTFPDSLRCKCKMSCNSFWMGKSNFIFANNRKLKQEDY